MFKITFKRNGKQFNKILSQVDAYILMAQSEIEIISMIKINTTTGNECLTTYWY